jgi:hypothetical protein
MDRYSSITGLCGPALNCVRDEVPGYRPKSFKQKRSESAACISRHSHVTCWRHHNRAFDPSTYDTPLRTGVENLAPRGCHLRREFQNYTCQHFSRRLSAAGPPLHNRNLKLNALFANVYIHTKPNVGPPWSCTTWFHQYSETNLRSFDTARLQEYVVNLGQ